MVKSSFTIGSRLYVGNNTVNLILCDGATLTANDGIGVSKNGTLNIYGQMDDTGKLYSHYDKGPESEDINKAVIGSDSGDTGNIRIHGGSLDIETGSTINSYNGAAIGGGNGGAPAKIEIFGGNIKARTHGHGAAIGGGNGGKTSWNQSGGTGTAAGIVIYAGHITAKGDYGAAIGSGESCSGDNGAIAIFGGEVEAIESSLAAGIGGGQYSANGPIDIYGGMINASGVNSRYTGAGIGSGRGADQSKPIHIHGGTIVATGGSGAGIGAGYKGNAGVISISDASVVASSTAGGAGIGGGDDTDGGTYKFSFKMAPAQFADDITIELYASEEEDTPEFSATTNVKAKCDQVIDLAKTDDYYASYAALCAALEDYCVASQVYFGYKAPETPEYNNGAVTTLIAADMEAPTATVGIDASGYSFTIVSGLEVNVFYSGKLSVTGVSIDSTKGVNAVTAATTGKGGKNCINIKGIASGNFDNLVTVNTTKGDITLAATTIAKAVVAGSGNANYVNLARALYLYSVQASDYFDC